MIDERLQGNGRARRGYTVIDRADRVDVSSYDSFPGSDPPSWIASGIGSPHAQQPGVQSRLDARPGYNPPLYLLPFDHRDSYISGMFRFTPPLTTEQHRAVVDSKRVIYDGFQQAVGSAVPVNHAGIMIDEEFGADIIRDAEDKGYITALSTEKSGSREFDFEYGDAFAQHLDAFQPTFAKVLVRYNPHGDAALNKRQTLRLKQLSDHCSSAERLFMFELLVPATKSQIESVNGDESLFDVRIRPDLTVEAIEELQDNGVEPDVWKIEGLERREDCERVVAAARRGSRDAVGCIVLGRGADAGAVINWLETAASVTGFIGFAVGRTTFWDAVSDYVEGKVQRAQAVSTIAQRFSEWASVFERARLSQ